MIRRALRVNLSFVLSIAIVVLAMPWICLAEDEKQDNGPLDSLKIDLGEQKTYWEDGRVTIKVPGIAKGMRPRTKLQLTDRDGAVIETLFEGRLRAAGLTTQIQARDLPPGSYRLRLEAKLGGNVSRTTQEILVILPHRDYRTYVATGCYAAMGFRVGPDGKVSTQSRDFEEAHMNTVLHGTVSRSVLDAAAFVGVIGHYRIGWFRQGPSSWTRWKAVLGWFFQCLLYAPEEPPGRPENNHRSPSISRWASGALWIHDSGRDIAPCQRLLLRALPQSVSAMAQR